MPEGLKDRDSGFGWHLKEDDFHYVVVREPKLFRTHTDLIYCFRSAWIKTMAGWDKIEDDMVWTSMPCPTQRIADEWIEKAIFGFRKTRLSPVAVAEQGCSRRDHPLNTTVNSLPACHGLMKTNINELERWLGPQA